MPKTLIIESKLSTSMPCSVPGCHANLRLISIEEGYSCMDPKCVMHVEGAQLASDEVEEAIYA